MSDDTQSKDKLKGLYRTKGPHLRLTTSSNILTVPADVPDDTWERWKKTEAEYESMQDEMAQAFEAGVKKLHKEGRLHG
jgi:hypothetical protein